MSEPLATITVDGELHKYAYIVMQDKDGKVLAGIYSCTTCKGEGLVDAYPESPESTSIVPCDDCGGSGLVSERVYLRLAKTQ